MKGIRGQLRHFLPPARLALGSRVRLKVLHIPFGVTEIPKSFDKSNKFRLLEGVVGDGRNEYPLVCRGDGSLTLHDTLQQLQDKVVNMDPVGYCTYDQVDQLEIGALRQQV